MFRLEAGCEAELRGAWVTSHWTQRLPARPPVVVTWAWKGWLGCLGREVFKQNRKGPPPRAGVPGETGQSRAHRSTPLPVPS